VPGKPRQQRTPEEHAELAQLIDRTDGVGIKLRADLVAAQMPLPPDPGLVALAAAIERGVPMMTPCNGFQIAVQAGLLPGPNPGEAWSDVPGEPS
jgi:hypothetical protein